MVIDSIVSTVDIAPTIYDVAGLSPRIELNGVSLLPRIFGKESDAPESIYGETLLPIRFGKNELRAVKTQRYKLITAPALDKKSLFDLSLDPGETDDLLDKEGADGAARAKEYHPLAIEMKRDLDNYFKSAGSPVPQEPEVMDEETRDKLRKLGYL
jgi:arylsulfatase A-like enzyme